MKSISILAVLFLSSLIGFSQKPVKADTIIKGKGSTDQQLKVIKETKVAVHSDSAGGSQPKKSVLIDSTLQNRYGDLLDDDTLYNKKYSVWVPVIELFGINAAIWSADRYLLKADYSRIGPKTWRYNIKYGWEWDKDRFGINFVGHPYSGTLSYNAARSNGYNFVKSSAFSVAGSLIWEYFGENTRPSYNDIINTPVSGAFLGEILYRLSSNVLDDRTHGIERVSRELLAGIINPVRGFNRIIQGKSFRRTNKEVYEKEPLNVSVYAGLHYIDGKQSEIANIQFDYGNPFEKRSRKPFDFFKLRADMNIGVGRKILDNVTGYGILFGKNKQVGKMSMLVGAFQYYDYWDAKSFELGAIGFGAGVFTKLPLGKKSNLYTNLHLAAMPFSGNSRQSGPDTLQVRDYDYGGGLEGKFESTLNLGQYATASLIYYYYFVHTYVGASGNNFIGILKPRVTVRVYRTLNVGFEDFIYTQDRHLQSAPVTHLMRNEQKVFVLFYFEDKQRRGRYN